MDSDSTMIEVERDLLIDLEELLNRLIENADNPQCSSYEQSQWLALGHNHSAVQELVAINAVFSEAE